MKDPESIISQISQRSQNETSLEGGLQSINAATSAVATAQTTSETPFPSLMSPPRRRSFTRLADDEAPAVDVLATATFRNEPEANVGYFGEQKYLDKS